MVRDGRVDYAAGDVAATDGPRLTPVAGLEGEAAARAILADLGAGPAEDVEAPERTGVPSTVFTLPELVRIGLLEAEARQAGLDVEVQRQDTWDWFTQRRTGQTAAGAAVILERGTGRIVGAHLLGEGSVEIANVLALAMRAGLTAGAVADLVAAYPSAASDLGYLLPRG